MQRSLGSVEFRIPVSQYAYLHVFANIFDADIPLWIGLDYLDREG